MRHWQRHGFGLWALSPKASGQFVGRCGVGYLHELKDAELAYALARPFCGQGLATETVRRTLQHAFEDLRLPRVIGVARPENVASQKVMVKAGMTFRRRCRCDSIEAVMYSIGRSA
jgi:ribosomal-protein-alanine N-acetyltransferase